MAVSMFGIGIAAVCAALFTSLIKKSNKEYALALTLVTCALILTTVLGKLEPFLAQLQSVAGAQLFQGDALLVMLKAVGITIAGQLAAQVCKDAGESALAYTVNLAAKASVLIISLPLVTKLFGYLEEIIKL